MLAHLAADVGDNTMTILQFNPKLSIRQCFHYLSRQLDYFLLTRHKLQ